MSTAMERYQGVILIRLQNAGSKSEGHYAFLVRDDDMSVVKLCREGAVPADDPYFVPFDRQEVVVTGNHEPRVAGRLGGRAGRCRG